MTEKPLHVRVAEALGWADCLPFEAWGEVDPDHWCGEAPEPREVTPGFFSHHDDIPHFDTDWSATGPLIERLSILLAYAEGVGSFTSRWVAATGFGGGYGEHYIDDKLDQIGEGETPLIAVCNLILALHAAGKLPAQTP